MSEDTKILFGAVIGGCIAFSALQYFGTLLVWSILGIIYIGYRLITGKWADFL